MIEHIPETVNNALFYFHSAGRTSAEIRPFLNYLTGKLPNTYMWAGDGMISGSPLMRHNLFYGTSLRRYWFTFPMQNPSSRESFSQNSEAMGAILACSGAYINQTVDLIKERFKLPAEKIVLSGFQHGSCAALAAAMIRKNDPFFYTILFQPYILESYYLEYEEIPYQTTVVCIENLLIQQRTKKWLNIETEKEFQKIGINTLGITIENGKEQLDIDMIKEAVKIIRSL